MKIIITFVMIVTAQAIGIVEMTIKPNPADWAATLLDRIGSCLAVWATLIITMLVRHVHKEAVLIQKTMRLWHV